MYGNSAECKSTKNSHGLTTNSCQLQFKSFTAALRLDICNIISNCFITKNKHVLPIEPLTIKEMHFSALVISLSCMSGSWIF